jgi:hypothetical protein
MIKRRNAMAAGPIVTAGPSATLAGKSTPSRLGARVKRTVQLRAGRLRMFLLVTVLLLPLLLTVLLDGR